MEVWIPLISACVGGLIATIPILLGLAVQLYINISDRKQKEKEAKIQDKKKWLERDVLVIMDSISTLITMLSKYNFLEIESERLYKQIEYNKEKLEEADALISELKKIHSDAKISLDVIDGLVNSFDDDFVWAWLDFEKSINDYLEITTQTYERDAEIEDEKWMEVRDNYGKFLSLSRKKLISIRDSE